MEENKDLTRRAANIAIAIFRNTEHGESSAVNAAMRVLDLKSHKMGLHAFEDVRTGALERLRREVGIEIAAIYDASNQCVSLRDGSLIVFTWGWDSPQSDRKPRPKRIGRVTRQQETKGATSSSVQILFQGSEEDAKGFYEKTLAEDAKVSS